MRRKFDQAETFIVKLFDISSLCTWYSAKVEESVSVQSCLRAYHIYKDIWTTVLGGNLYASRRGETIGNCTVLSSSQALFSCWMAHTSPVGLFQQFLKVLVSQTVSLLGLEDHPHGSDNVVYRRV